MQRKDVLLIKEIDTRPSIYNKLHPSYRINLARDTAWKEIAEVVGLTDVECRKKWRTFRDSFSRCYKSIQAAGDPDNFDRRTWKYYEHMLFLIPHLENKEINSTEQESFKASEHLQLSYNDNSFMDTEEQAVENEPKHNVESQQKQQYETKHNPTELLENFINSEQPDSRFLLSLLPILKRLPPKENSLARIRIQQVLYEIEFDEKI